MRIFPFLFFSLSRFHFRQIFWVQTPFLDSLQSNRHWTTTITLRLQTQKDYAIYSILIIVCSHLGMYLECMFFISTASKSSSAAGLRCLSAGLENNSIQYSMRCDAMRWWRSWTCKQNNPLAISCGFRERAHFVFAESSTTNTNTGA